MSLKNVLSIRTALFAAVIAGAGVLGCGPVEKECTSATCAGCCDDEGVCQIGTVQNACGVTGSLCAVCGNDAVCSGGVCVTFNGGGKKDGGTGGSDAGVDGGLDAGTDAGSDAGIDGGIDGGADAGSDGGIDAGSDAGCQVNGSFCSSAGQCCSEYCSSSGTCATPPPDGGALTGDSCSAPESVTLVNDTFSDTGDTTGYTNDISTTVSGCSSATGGDVIYTFYNPGTADLSATVTTSSSTYRPVIYFRGSNCTASTIGSCGVASTGGQSVTATIKAQPAGYYHVIVDGAVSTNGPYALSVTRTPVSSGAAGETCSSPIALTFSGTTTQTASLSGTTVGGVHDHNHSCAQSTSTAPDKVYTFTTTATKSFTATVTPSPAWDVGISLFGGPCATGSELLCEDASSTAPETISNPSLPPGTYYLWIDGYTSTESGAYTLSVTLQ